MLRTKNIAQKPRTFSRPKKKTHTHKIETKNIKNYFKTLVFSIKQKGKIKLKSYNIVKICTHTEFKTELSSMFKIFWKIYNFTDKPCTEQIIHSGPERIPLNSRHLKKIKLNGRRKKWKLLK